MALNRPINAKVNQPINSGVAYKGTTVIPNVASGPSERITNGQFSDGSNWTIQLAGWTIAAGVATNTTPNRRLSQQYVGGVLITGTKINITLTVTNPAGDEFAINMLASNGTTVTETVYDDFPAVGPGTVSVVDYVLGVDAYGIQFLPVSGGVGGIIIDNVSLIA